MQFRISICTNATSLVVVKYAAVVLGYNQRQIGKRHFLAISCCNNSFTHKLLQITLLLQYRLHIYCENAVMFYSSGVS